MSQPEQTPAPLRLVTEESLSAEGAEALTIAFDLVSDIGGVDDHILNRAERNGLRLARYVLSRAWYEESDAKHSDDNAHTDGAT